MGRAPPPLARMGRGTGRRRQAQPAFGQAARQLAAAVLEQPDVVADQLVVAGEHQLAIVTLVETAVGAQFQADAAVGAGPDAGDATADQWTVPQAAPARAEAAVARAVAVSQAATNHRGAAWGRRGVYRVMTSSGADGRYVARSRADGCGRGLGKGRRWRRGGTSSP